MELAILNYRYRLWPTPQQECALETGMAFACRAWNSMVSLRRHALDQCRRGREASVRNALIELECARKPVGMRAAKLKRLAAEMGGNPLQLLRTEIEERVRALGRWQLAQEFAIARAAEAKTKKVGSEMGKAWWQVADAFGLACKALRPGQQLRFRRRDESAPLRVQHQLDLPVRRRQDGVWFADLGGLLPADQREALRWMRYEAHRDLPPGARVKRIAVTGDRLGWHVVFALEAPRAAVAKDFPTTGRTAGVDPGRSIAFTVAPADSPDHGQSDGFELWTTKGRGRLLRRVARLARKADRQRRAANPDCYRPDGTVIRGRRPRRTSKGLESTLDQLAEQHRHFRARRTEFYHLAAGELLRGFDCVKIGNWIGLVPGAAAARKRNAKLIERLTGAPPAPSKPRAKGVRARERGQRRKDAANALGEFRRVIGEKAKLSRTAKEVVEVREHGSTRTCPACGDDSGPRGLQQLGVRRWTCAGCGKTFLRDRAAAYQLATRSPEQAGDTAGYGAPARRAKAPRQRARSAAVEGQTEPVTAPTQCAALRERSGGGEVTAGRSRSAEASVPEGRSCDRLDRTRRAPARPSQPFACPEGARSHAGISSIGVAVPG